MLLNINKRFLSVLMTVYLGTTFFITGCVKENTDTDGNITVSITGTAQKGQFVKGTQLTAFALNGELIATGLSFPGSISDDLGNFTVSGETSAPYLELRAEGYYFDELTGNNAGPLYLEALAAPDAGCVNINILTTIIRPRVKKLILDGQKYAVAVSQAQKEFMSSIGIELDSLTDFDQMDITKSSDSDAFLLALSCLVQADAKNPSNSASAADVGTLLQNLATDMEDGVLSQANVAALKNKSAMISVSKIINNLTSFYNAKGVDAAIPAFWKFLSDSDNGEYMEVLDSRLVKGVVVDKDECSCMVIDASFTEERITDLAKRYDSAELQMSFASSAAFDLYGSPDCIGGYKFELTVLKKGNAQVTSPDSWIVVGEGEQVGEDTYKYVIDVRPDGTDGQVEGSLSIGGINYVITLDQDHRYDVSQLHFTSDDYVKLIVFREGKAEFELGDKVRVNGSELVVWKAPYAGVVFVPKAERYEVICLKDGSRSTELKEESEYIVYVYLQGADDNGGQEKYVCVECPFIEKYGYDAVQPYNTEISINGATDCALFGETGNKRIYVVSEAYSYEVRLTTQIFGFAEGIADLSNPVSIADLGVEAYPVTWNKVSYNEITEIVADDPYSASWVGGACCYGSSADLQYIYMQPLASSGDRCGYVPANITQVLYKHHELSEVRGTISDEIDEGGRRRVVWDAISGDVKMRKFVFDMSDLSEYMSIITVNSIYTKSNAGNYMLEESFRVPMSAEYVVNIALCELTSDPMAPSILYEMTVTLKDNGSDPLAFKPLVSDMPPVGGGPGSDSLQQ